MLGRTTARSTGENPSAGAERELAQLIREIEEARSSGQGRVAFVHGPSGVGKHNFFAQLRRRLAASGIRVFEGGGRAEHRGAYGLFRSLIPELLAHLTEAGVPARLVGDLQRRTLPVRGGHHPGGDDPALDLADATAEIFLLAGRSTPAFILTDLDSADRASLELLRYLLATARAPGAQTGGLFVLGYRDDAPLPSPLAEVVTKVGGLSIGLAGLDVEGIRAYLSQRDVVEHLLDLTGGIPAVLDQVIRAVPEDHPEAFFLQRVRRLPREDQDILTALAVLGDPTTEAALASTLVSSVGQAPLDLGSRLRRLSQARVLATQLERQSERFSFARDADREILYRGLPQNEQHRFHLAWGLELRKTGAEPEEVARHLLASGDPEAGRAAAVRAAEALDSRLAFDDAIELYLQALALSPEPDRQALHLKLLSLYRKTADYPAALRHAGLWRRTLPPAEKRQARAEAAQILVSMGRLASAEKQLLLVLGPEPKLAPDPASARAWADLAELAFLRGDYAKALPICAAGGGVYGDRPELVFALRNTEGKVHLARGEYSKAEAAFSSNFAEARAEGRVREAAQAQLNQGVVAHRRGDKRAAITLYRAALPDLDKKGQAHALSNLGSLFAESGDFDSAADHLTRALGAFSRARRRKEVAHCAGNLARLYVFLGDLNRAAELCEHMKQTAAAVGDPYLQASARLIGAELAEARGDSSTAWPEFQASELAFAALQSPRYAAEAALGSARAALAIGERADARTALASPTIAAMVATSSAISAERELVAGELALVAGELPEATRRLAKAKEILLAEPDLEGPYRVYGLLSRLRTAAGDSSGAAADASRAGRLLDELIARVPPHRRDAFVRVPRRAQVLADAAEHEITPGRVQRALELEVERRAPLSSALVGRCDAVERVLRVLGPVSRSSTTVLIRGESGTGKELVAEAVHHGSSRRDMPLIKVNCAAMVEELLMSELFGHERGAFTGAVRERKGRFELAEGGTLFLDEIGDVSPKMQVALLRVLQEREFERVGGTKTIKVDVRVIAATNRDLESMIPNGQFRQDLYYRLKGVVIELPPLRERGDDLSLLCSHFLAKIARERGEEPRTLSPESLAMLQGYPFPGNIRELENVLSSATLFANHNVVGLDSFDHLPEFRVERPQPTIEAKAPPEPVRTPKTEPTVQAAVPAGAVDYFELARSRNLSLKDLRREVENQCIQRALQESKGNISEASRILKMKRSRLSQIVNAEPELLALTKGDASFDPVGADDEGD